MKTRIESACSLITPEGIQQVFSNVDLLRSVIESICWVKDYKTQVMTPVTLNGCQLRILDEVVRQYSQGDPVRILIVKSRRVGGSMLSAILATLQMMAKPDYSVTVASHQLSRVSTYLLLLYTNLLDHLPDPLRQFRGKAQRRAFGHGRTLVHNKSNLLIDVETDIRGRDSGYLHCSEIAFFKNAAKFLSAFEPSIPYEHGTFIILESTPAAYDDHFHRMYEASINGETSYTPIFIPWQDFEHNQLPCTESEAEDIMNNLHARHSRYGNEIDAVEKHNLTPEQVKWRRKKLGERDMNSFLKEYPGSVEEAFAAADSLNVFDMNALRFLRARAVEPSRQGEMRTDVALHWEKPPSLELQSLGLVQIWDDPDPTKEYVAGSDHSQGKHDWNSLTILQRMPLKLVATLHGDRTNKNIIPGDFAKQMLHLLKYYNYPHTAIEINDVGNTISTLLQQWDYYNLLTHQNLFPDSMVREPGGWRNTSSTRSHGVEILKMYIQNELIQIPDEETIKELMHFIYSSSANDLSKAKPQAAKKGQPKVGVDNTGLFDDRVFSLISALLAHESLPAVLSDRERAIENRQVDHDIIYRDHFAPPSDDFDIAVPFDEYEFDI